MAPSHTIYDNEQLEKGTESQTEMAATTNGANQNYANKGSALEKKLLRRIDIRLLPALG